MKQFVFFINEGRIKKNQPIKCIFVFFYNLIIMYIKYFPTCVCCVKFELYLWGPKNVLTNIVKPVEHICIRFMFRCR